MSSLKPVIHGRDHLPGGADPIPQLVEAVLAGLGSAEEHLSATDTATAGSGFTAAWGRFSGTTIMDLSTATNPQIQTRGIYAFSGTVQVDPPISDGVRFDVYFFAIQSLLGWPTSYEFPGSATSPGVNDSLPVYVPVSVVARMDPGDTFFLNVFNGDSVDVSVKATMSVVRILEF